MEPYCWMKTYYLAKLVLILYKYNPGSLFVYSMSSMIMTHLKWQSQQTVYCAINIGRRNCLCQWSLRSCFHFQILLAKPLAVLSHDWARLTCLVMQKGPGGMLLMLTCGIGELVNMLSKLDQFEHLWMPMVGSELMTVFKTLHFNYNL